MHIIYIVNNASFFISHRLCIAEAVIKSGGKATLLAPPIRENDYRRLLGAGVEFHELPFEREKRTLWGMVRTFFWGLNFIRKERAAVYHFVTIFPILLMGIPARMLGRRCVFAISGLGSVFTNKSAPAVVVQFVIIRLYRWLFRSDRTRVIVQNAEDLEFVREKIGVSTERAVIIRGSGVDPKLFPFQPEVTSSNRPIILLPGRLIWQKGIGEAVEASRILNEELVIDHELRIIGGFDLGNPSCLSMSDVACLKSISPNVTFVGESRNVFDELKRCTLVCLPTYREGLPKALIEALAVGRAVVTTDTVGCREIIQHNKNGTLVPVKDARALAFALAKLVGDKETRKRFIEEGFRNFELSYTLNLVIKATIELYLGFEPPEPKTPPLKP